MNGVSSMMNYQYAIRYTLHKPRTTSDKRPATRSAKTIAQKNLIMQNKANFPDAQIFVTCVLTMDYVNIRLRSRLKNKAKQTQFKPNFRKAKMNVSSVKTKDYEKNDIFSVPQNKANSKPIFRSFCLTHAAPSPQSNPIFENSG
jgi:hypothetical protein